MGDWEDLARALLQLVVAYALGIPIGWVRERLHGIGPGLRTYPLLSLGACGFLLVGQVAFADDPDAQARVFQGLVSGIGFIGAGAIIKGRAEVHGHAAAVSLWVTVCVGAAVAYHLLLLAAFLSATTLVTLRLFTPFKPPAEEAERGSGSLE
jgi:putative Mg2+ transporter-C (MgtC) family protein